jgi:hypothetical protein
LPEATVALFAFLLHFVWEMLQVPLFVGMAQVPHWAALLFCLQATIGDTAIALFSYSAASAVSRDRRWLLRPRKSELTIYLAAGLVATLFLERMATGPLARWQYVQQCRSFLDWKLGPHRFCSGSFCHSSRSRWRADT